MIFNQQCKTPDSNSYIKLPSAKVIELATECLSYIKGYRVRATQKLIEETRQDIVKGFWHRLLKKPVPNDKEVLAHINYEPSRGFPIVPETVWISIRYQNTEEVANRLLLAAKNADELYVHTDDFSRLTFGGK